MRCHGLRRLHRQQGTFSGSLTTAALAALACASQAAAQVYTVTTIETFGGVSSLAYGLNDAGAVVGRAQNAAGQDRAFLFSGGVLQDLGTLGGSSSQATAINNAGHVVGFARTIAGLDHAFRYSAGTMNDLGTLGGSSSYAFAINDASQVAGGATTNNDARYHAFRVIGPSMQDLGSLGGGPSSISESAGIDADGSVVGYTSVSGPGQQGFVYRNNTMTPLSTLGGDYSYAQAIRNGVIVGGASTPGDVAFHAARWTNGVISDLGTLLGLPRSIAYALSASGQVVGTSDDGTEASARAFLHLGAAGTMIDLNDLIPAGAGWTLQEARGINASGQVAGWGTFSGQRRAFLLNLTGKIWSNPAGGAFATADNWFTPGAPAAAQPAAFPLAATYTVGIAAPATNQSVLVSRGDVTFDFANDATYTVTDAVTIRAGSTLRVQGAGRLSANAIDSAGALRITSGEVQLRPGGGTSATAQLDFGGSSGAWTGRLDLSDNALVIDYTGASPVANVRDQIRTARGGAGAWDGNGIASSIANASSIGVGYAEAAALFSSFPATFAGRSVDDTSVLIRPTRYGDANLDGQVNLADFNRLAANFGTSGAFWHQGDFNYDGNVNLSDFNALAANFGLAASGPIITPQDWARIGAAVPEPAAGALVVGVGIMLARRAGRHRGAPRAEVG